MDPKVSIIIPVYNGEKYIQQTMESVFNQSFSDFELIVVNDGSTDNTEQKIQFYSGNPKLRYLIQKNAGPAAALNTGIRISKGKYLAFLDADDLFHQDKLKNIIEFMDNLPHFVMVHTNGYGIDAESNNTGINLVPYHFEETNNPKKLLLNNYIKSPSCVVIRKWVTKEIGGFNENYFAHDHDMWLRIMEKFEVGYLAIPLVYYRWTSSQMSTGIRQWEDSFKILDAACKRYPYGWNVRRKRLAVLYYRFAQHYKKLKYYLLAGLLDPIRAIKELLKK